MPLKAAESYTRPGKGKAGGVGCVAIDLPTKQLKRTSTPPSAGFLVFNSRKTQTPLSLTSVMHLGAPASSVPEPALVSHVEHTQQLEQLPQMPQS